MAPKKVDVQLDESGLVQAVAAGLRAGSRVELRRNDEGGLYCVTEGGEVIGPIASAAAAAPAAAAAATATALGGTFGGAVRTVRRRLDDNAVVQVLVRFVEERARACKAGESRCRAQRCAAISKSRAATDTLAVRPARRSRPAGGASRRDPRRPDNGAPLAPAAGADRCAAQRRQPPVAPLRPLRPPHAPLPAPLMCSGGRRGAAPAARRGPPARRRRG